jgi:hypothetical protein
MLKFISQAKIIVLALALALGISYVSAAGTWTGPTATPPGGNVDTPVNVGNNAQSKAGDLSVGAFLANLNSLFLGNVTIGSISAPAQFKLINGAQGSGKVLASDASGSATWVSTSSLGISGGGTSTTTVQSVNVGFTTFQVFNSSGSFTVPSGVTKTMVEVWGAGGGGYRNGGDIYSGAGGGYAKGIYTVSPGASYTVTVGDGGAARVNGGLSRFGALLTASGGTAGNSNGYGIGGLGSGTGSIITVSGGDGNGSGSVGNVGGAGGNGGAGGSAGNVGLDGCTDGKAPGGGGGQGGGYEPDECAGGDGRVVVWW